MKINNKIRYKALIHETYLYKLRTGKRLEDVMSDRMQDEIARKWNDIQQQILLVKSSYTN